MSSTELELVERMYTAFRSRDFEAFRALCTPNIEWVQSAGFPNGRTYTGPDAVIDGVFNANDARWREFRFEIDSMHAADGTVFVLGRYTGKRLSGEGFQAEATHVYEVENGLIHRFRMFADTHILQQNL